jgi:hypothetical protein
VIDEILLIVILLNVAQTCVTLLCVIMLNDPLLKGHFAIMSVYQVTSSSNGIVLNDIRMNVILPIVIQFSLLLLNGIQINFCSAE